MSPSSPSSSIDPGRRRRDRGASSETRSSAGNRPRAPGLEPDTIERLFFRRVDAASLSAFRIAFGALMLFEAVNYGLFLCLDCLYRDTDLLFKYRYFEWVGLLPGPGLEIVFVVMGLAAIGVMLGLFYRLSAVLLVLSFGYLFLLDQALYLNHFYLALLYATILVFVPANRLWSLDARRRPALRSDTVPNWGRFWLGAQTEIVLLYAGIVKLNADWLQLEPMRLWMGGRAADAAPFFQWITQDPGIAIASWGVILLHLVGAPLLLWRRTRLPVFCLYACFHLINAFVFDIGIFPFMTIAATLMLFDADWPRQVYRRLRRPDVAGVADVDRPRAGMLGSPDRATAGGVTARGTAWRTALVAVIALWLVAQIVVPLRHYAAPGDVAWNEDGHRFSWRMKLRSKRGTVDFVVAHADGSREVIDPAEHLTPKQVRALVCIPDLLWQYARFAETTYRRDADEDVAVYARTRCSLNTREAIPLVRPDVDLTSIPRDAPSSRWLTVNDEPLPHPLTRLPFGFAGR